MHQKNAVLFRDLSLLVDRPINLAFVYFPIIPKSFFEFGLGQAWWKPSDDDL